MTEKVFGIVHTQYEAGANSPSLAVQEVTAGEILRDMHDPEPEFVEWLQRSDPGEYWEGRGRVIFRAR